MERNVAAAIAAVHASPAMAVLVATGGGMQALGWIMGVPGASRTVLEAVVPYSRLSFVDFISRHCQTPKAAPDHFSSCTGARRLALAAYNRALVLATPGVPVLGLGCSCSLATASPKAGPHRCHVAARSQNLWLEYSLQLNKASTRTRWEEDELASRLLVKALADASVGTDQAEQYGLFRSAPWQAGPLQGPQGGADSCGGRGGAGARDVSKAAAGAACVSGIEANRDPSGGRDAMVQAQTSLTVAQQLQEVLDGVTPMAMFTYGPVAHQCSTPEPGGYRRRVLLSGSFNPLHHGHTGLMAAALRMVPGGLAHYEIAGLNADKGHIPVEELLRRLEQFAQTPESLPCAVIVTGEPLFASKAQLLPNSTFIVGFDTAIRLIDPKYYGGSEAKMQQVLEGIAAVGCDFLVAPRLVGQRFQTFDDLKVPSSISCLFKGINGFRIDVSSTDIRKRLQKQGPA